MRRLLLCAGVIALVGGTLAFGRDLGANPDTRAILRVMAAARTSLLADQDHSFCSLLTEHGRKRSLGFKVDCDAYGSVPSNSPRLPQTCEQIVRREWRDEHRANVDQSWIPDLRVARFRVVWIRGARARVRLSVQRHSYEPPATASFWLRRTHAGWRIDDSNIVPVGH